MGHAQDLTPPGPLGNLTLVGTSAGALTVHRSQVQGVSLRSFYKRSPGQVTFTMDPVRDLLIWAIVQNRRELGEIIWAQVTRHVAVSGPVTGLQQGAWPASPALSAGGGGVAGRAMERGQWASQHLKGLRVSSVENRGLSSRQGNTCLKGKTHNVLQVYAGRRLAPTGSGGQRLSCGHAVRRLQGRLRPGRGCVSPLAVEDLKETICYLVGGRPCCPSRSPSPADSPL